MKKLTKVCRIFIKLSSHQSRFMESHTSPNLFLVKIQHMKISYTFNRFQSRNFTKMKGVKGHLTNYLLSSLKEKFIHFLTHNIFSFNVELRFFPKEKR